MSHKFDYYPNIVYGIFDHRISTKTPTLISSLVTATRPAMASNSKVLVFTKPFVCRRCARMAPIPASNAKSMFLCTPVPIRTPIRTAMSSR